MFDLLALLGISNASGLRIFGFFKMIRVRRLSTYIARLNLTKEFKSLINILKLTLYLFLFLHIQACIWFMVISVNGKFEYDNIENDYEINNETFVLYRGSDKVTNKILFKPDPYKKF